MVAYTVSLGSDMLQMTKICFWHLFLRDSGLIYFQLATVEPVIYLKSSGKTKVTKVRFFRKNLTSGGELALKNAHFYYKFPFCANLVISLGVFFSQVWLIIAKIGIFTTDMCWSVTGAHFASVLYDPKSRKLKLKKWRREKGRSETTICGPTTSENFSWSFALDYMFNNLYLIR